MFWRQAQVQKSAEHYTEAAQDEIDLLAAIAGHAHRSAEGAAACVRMLDNFEHRGPHGRHVCMVFEVRRGWSGCRCPLAASWATTCRHVGRMSPQPQLLHIVT